ncbi:Fe(3+)-hydroxamate ABC transporter permease FhuB [Photobacterium sp. 1_MG-2023]|uniref:Fe(3+)-hydroxamate ABC transporter permease FhuB n=1 Tax=Photobacterium sp. 1_MG-2023 TaxID=3062646 RepID=UPI0026E12649|nr:Fe(3+)-hydroxamate ABC transporter permease FhuB [Photobacterium sp. 1_MG-2023]MDO6707312.1 Fe(3+)-hydroxamate ABC transporter permease FhuB [Photobacterium sp. 1_MG-2023]
MTRTVTVFPLMLLALLSVAFASLQIGGYLTLSRQLALISGVPADAFGDVMFTFAQLPRLVMGLMVGAMLGLVGSLMQQLTQNPLTSPLTLGTSSGAWLALIIVNVWFPDWVGDHSALAAMAGAMLSLFLVIFIAGPKNMTGLPLVLSGMVVNILLGAVASAIILLNAEYAKNVFIWGAGDLTQNGWESVQWLLPRLSVSLLLLVFAPRILTLMRLGHQGAAARGLNVVPAFICLMAIGLWLVAASITTVGVISFIGLLTPNIARALGARTPKLELYASALLGALLLVATDAVAQLLSQWTLDAIPSGITAAAIGAPALLWFSRRKMKAQDQVSIKLPPSRDRLARWTQPILLIAVAGMLVLSACFVTDGHAWQMTVPSAYQWELRWPRMLTALSAGVGLALAGTILQRLIYNPLASPDILGISAGATFALVGASVFLGINIFAAGSVLAFTGSLVVLAVLLVLGRRHHFAPSSLILIGIALTALIDALVQFALAKGTQDSYSILTWLAGSTYRVTTGKALFLMAGVGVLFIFTLMTSRWLTLISAGRQFAAARGLNVTLCSALLLATVALLCALVTATMGPVAFVGLLAPHMAVMLGAKQAREQLMVASLVGGVVMLVADWVGQTVLFPAQIAAGTLVSVIGGSYFLFLLIRGRARSI